MARKHIVVLGAGRVGSAIAADLSADYSVTAVDADASRLSGLAEQHSLLTTVADLSDVSAVRQAIGAADLVVGAVPGFMGFQTAETVIRSGKHYVDISFFNEDPFRLDEAAKAAGVTAVVDCGVAPGLDNILLGYHHGRMRVTAFECLVGGLPVKRHWPFEYKAPFSPIDVIAEYTRPARLVRDGRHVVLPALSEPELIDFPGVGQLEAFNTDGLRTLLHTLPVRDMAERTLRYPGHCELMRIFRETGFFREDPVDAGGVSVRPLDLTANLLFPHWKAGADEEEFTLMRVTITGEKEGKPARAVYHLLDHNDTVTHTSSMARTTGYTCTAVARLVVEGKYRRAGIIPPEYVGEDEGCFRFILGHLATRGIRLTMETEEIAPVRL
jgi:lysine 6-dehydrogenase